MAGCSSRDAPCTYMTSHAQSLREHQIDSTPITLLHEAHVPWTTKTARTRARAAQTILPGGIDYPPSKGHVDAPALAHPSLPGKPSFQVLHTRAPPRQASAAAAAVQLDLGQLGLDVTPLPTARVALPAAWMRPAARVHALLTCQTS